MSGGERGASAPLDLDAVEALCAAATPAPWEAFEERNEYFGVERKVSDGNECTLLCDIGCNPTMDDLRFIAAARTLVPQLVARVRELEAVGEHDMEPPPNARELVEQMRKEVGCGMMQAKQALEDEDWNYDDAKEALRYAGTTRGRPALIERLRRRIRALEAENDKAHTDLESEINRCSAMVSARDAKIRRLEAGPDDAALDRVIMTLADRVDGDGEFDATYTELRAAIRAALKGE